MEQDKKDLNTGSADGRRTDSVILLHTGANGTSMLSLPRDSWVTLPPYVDPDTGRSYRATPDKLNAAFWLGGPDLLVQTVERNTGVHIDHYAEIGFAGFVGVVDAVGGVDMCLDKAVRDKDSGADLPAGCQTLDGSEALAFVRQRKQEAQGDLGRTRNQQKFLAALARKAATPTTLADPVQVPSDPERGPRHAHRGRGHGAARPHVAVRGDAEGHGRRGQTAQRARGRPEPAYLQGQRGEVGRPAGTRPLRGDTGGPPAWHTRGRLEERRPRVQPRQHPAVELQVRRRVDERVQVQRPQIAHGPLDRHLLVEGGGARGRAEQVGGLQARSAPPWLHRDSPRGGCQRALRRWELIPASGDISEPYPDAAHTLRPPGSSK